MQLTKCLLTPKKNRIVVPETAIFAPKYAFLAISWQIQALPCVCRSWQTYFFIITRTGKSKYYMILEIDTMHCGCNGTFPTIVVVKFFLYIRSSPLCVVCLRRDGLMVKTASTQLDEMWRGCLLLKHQSWQRISQYQIINIQIQHRESIQTSKLAKNISISNHKYLDTIQGKYLNIKVGIEYLNIKSKL